MCGTEHFPAGQGRDENLRAGKNNKNQLNQKFGKSAFIVIGKFVMHFGILKRENIISSKFKKKSVYKEDSQKVKLKAYICLSSLFKKGEDDLPSLI